MSPQTLSCSFCTHRNPLDAKFCNQCGSPLGLKPCPSCEAVNEQSAERCHQCGAAFIAMQTDVATAVDDLTAAEAASQALADEARAEAFAGTGVSASPHGGESVVAAPFVSDETASPTGHESTVAAPFAVDAALDAPIHIPESFADRLERENGLHPFERAEPRIALSDDRGDVHDFAAASHVMRNRRMTTRGRTWRAPLVLAVLIVLTGAGYYAYRHDAPGLDRLAAFALAGWHGGESTSAERGSGEAPAAATGANDAAENAPSTPAQAAQGGSSPATPATAAQSTTSAATPATASSNAPSSSEPNPAGSALVSVEPGAPGRATADAQNVAPTAAAKARPRPAASASRNDEEAASQRSESASRSRRQADADAIATQRLIARDLGIATSPPADAPSAPLDRDAVETKRLIERDLGPFLHRNGRSSMGTYPASN